MLGAFTFILHTHLPYVLHHGKWPHGSDWLSEAVAECYLPILRVLEGLQSEGFSPRISMDFSPINLEQLADPLFQDTFIAYCDEKIAAAELDYTFFATNGEAYLQPLAEFWREFYSRTKKEFLEKYNGNVISGFRKLSDAGILDAMTCGATHGYFPLLLHDANIRAQLRCAIETHEKHFGKRPRGIWLPECGYRPRYRWSPPVGTAEYKAKSENRAGVEELVAETGLEYFVVDGALTRGGRTVPAYQPLGQKLHEKYLEEIGPRGEPVPEYDPTRSLTDIYWVDSRKSVGQDGQGIGSMPSNLPAIFSRDPKSASRVWAADLGYPGAGVYLDFHKKHHNSGLRYWRVTGSRVDLGDKQPYVPYHTEWQLDLDAEDFVTLVRRELVDHKESTGRTGILAAPFDTELFGHWWFEGPRFLEKVMRRMSTSSDVKLTDCAEALDTYDAPRVTIALPEGSWGEGGHHFVWANHDVAWMWDSIYPLEDRFLKSVQRFLKSSGTESPAEGGLLRTILEQAARELLLMEASDWQFVISTGGAVEYSKERFGEHCEFLTKLLDMAERYEANEGLNEDDATVLQEALVKDRPFANINLHWWDSNPVAVPDRPAHSQRTPKPASVGI
jgi:1,4-alpha-glucan branching enzyme